jgi:dihydrofolate synthase/folylpolyglutamate synthase
VITSVGLDHQEFLGRTLAKIAFEKAGIIKPGVPLVCGLVPGIARRVINRRARELGAPVRGALDESGALRARRHRNGYRFFFRYEGEEYAFSPGLRGEHQGRNAALAIAAAMELSRSWRRLRKSQIIQGLREAEWEGRLEVVSRTPTVVLDGAHNEAGAQAIAAYAREFLPKPLTLVLGIMKDKSIRRVSGALFPLADKIFLTSVPMPRAASPELIYSLAPVRKKSTFLEPDPIKAVEKAIGMTPRNGSVLITGSLYLVGEVKKLLHSKGEYASSAKR